MKKNLISVVLLSILFATGLFGQSIGSNNSKFEATTNVWLQNSNGKALTNSGDTLLSGDFFHAKWVAVQCSRLLQKDESITIIFQPPAGNTARAYRLNSNWLFEDVLKYAITAPQFTVVTIMIVSGNMPSKNANVLQIILK